MVFSLLNKVCSKDAALVAIQKLSFWLLLKCIPIFIGLYIYIYISMYTYIYIYTHTLTDKLKTLGLTHLNR